MQLEKRGGGGGGGGGQSCVIDYLLNYSRCLYTSVWRVMRVVHVEQIIVDQNIGE